jgi:hypothetical protein
MSISVNSKTVNVNKSELISKLKNNLKQHKEDYKEAVAGYKIKVEADFAKALENAKKHTAEQLVEMSLSINCFPPGSHENEYNEIIMMLEMSVDEVIQLDGQSFRQYVMNEWSWSKAFTATANMYKNIAAGNVG